MWHYQVVKYEDGYGICEELTVSDIRLLKSGEIVEGRKKSKLYTDNLLTDRYETVKELEVNLRLMLKDIKNYPPKDAKKIFK